MLVLTSLLTESTNAFGEGITAAAPEASGSYHWDGIAYLQSSVSYTFANGVGESTGGAMTPLCYLILLLGTVYVGKLWRVPMLRRLVSRPTAAAQD